MISCKDLQLEYNDLYIQMRKYIWDFRVIEALADLELACYNACVDLDEVSNSFYALKKCVLNVINEDEEFEDAFDVFEEFLKDNDEIYTPLYRVKEEITYEDIEERKEDSEHSFNEEEPREDFKTRQSF